MSAHDASEQSLVDRSLPPVTEIGAASMIAIAVGVIYSASYLPKHAHTSIAVAILLVAAALQLVNACLLRVCATSLGRGFARSRAGRCSHTP